MEPVEVKTWSSTVMVEQEDDVMLPCQHQLGSFITPSFWTFNGGALFSSERIQTDSSNNLIIRNVNWQDMGLYSCHLGDGGEVATFLYPLATV